MKLKFTKKLPESPGYYYWTNFGEHTPTILEVRKINGRLIASNEEFSLVVEKLDMEKVLKDAKEYEFEKIDGHYYGEELWAKIPDVTLNGEVIKPNSF